VISDTQFLLVLLNRGPQTRDTVIASCRAAGRPGMVVNSRISELRQQLGVTITCTREHRPGERDAYVYRLVRPVEAAA
jgi:hypothetical protein